MGICTLKNKEIKQYDSSIDIWKMVRYFKDTDTDTLKTKCWHILTSLHQKNIYFGIKYSQTVDFLLPLWYTVQDHIVFKIM